MVLKCITAPMVYPFVSPSPSGCGLLEGEVLPSLSAGRTHCGLAHQDARQRGVCVCILPQAWLLTLRVTFAHLTLTVTL